MTIGLMPMLTTFLGAASYLLALAIFVQVFQELYKYVTSSKSRAYLKALVDFAGPWAAQLQNSGSLPDLAVRGPFQLLRIRPPDRILPLDQKALSAAAVRTAPDWVQRTLERLESEISLQTGERNGPSPSWREFVGGLFAADRGSPGYWTARKVQTILEDWGVVVVEMADTGEKTLKEVGKPPAEALLRALKMELVPHIVNLEENYDQLSRNFEYTYKRRNIRQTFVIAVVIALVCNFPFDRIFREASALPAQTAIDAAEAMVRHWEAASVAPHTSGQEITQDQMAAMQVAIDHLGSITGGSGQLEYLLAYSDLRSMWTDKRKGVIYLFGCLVTAILVSFGAPLLHDLTRLLLGLQKNWRETPSVGQGV